MNKRLAIFTNQFPGRVSTFFSRDLYALLNQGYKIDVFPLYPIRSRYWENVPKKLRSEIKNKVDIHYVNPIHFYWNNVNKEVLQDIRIILLESLNYGFIQFTKSLYAIQQALLWPRYFDGKYDYILAYWGNFAATYAYIVHKLLKIRNPFYFFLHAGTDLYRDQIFLEQKILLAKKVFTDCDFNRTYLQNLFPQSYEKFENKIIVHHLSVDIDDIKHKIIGRENNTLLTIGYFSQKKGFHIAIKALSLLINDFPDIKLIMIGNGPEKRKLERLAKILRIKDRIVFKGWLPFDDVKKQLEKYSIFIHPSNDLGDASPTVIKEAMVAGMPVIGADIVGIPELLDYGKAGVLFPPNDEVALAESIKKLLIDHEIRTNFARMGRDIAVKKFNMFKNGEILARHLEENPA